MEEWKGTGKGGGFGGDVEGLEVCIYLVVENEFMVVWDTFLLLRRNFQFLSRPRFVSDINSGSSLGCSCFLDRAARMMMIIDAHQ